MYRTLLSLVVLVGCVAGCANPNVPSTNYVRDDVYCWHRQTDGRWRVQGFSYMCPAYTPRGQVSSSNL
jgi:hypothetical protein